jgi:hypothetical protein
MDRMLDRHPDVIVSGTAEDQGVSTTASSMWFNAPREVLFERVSTRTNNSYGKTIEQGPRSRVTCRPLNRSFGAVRPSN